MRDTNDNLLRISMQFFADDADDTSGIGDTSGAEDTAEEMALEIGEDDWITGETEETTPETAEGSESQEGAEEQAEEAGQEEEAGKDTDEAFVVKYNGQEIKLSRDEIIQHAQKGMNYDHVREERDRLREAREFAILDRFAAQNGMNRQQYLDALEQADTERQVAQRVEQGVPEEAARRLVELEQKERQQRQDFQRQQTETARRQQREEQVAAFHQEYPDVTEFPPEVLEMITKGETPVAAYRAYENKQLREQIAALNQQLAAKKVDQKNRLAAVGSVTGEGGKADPMMEAFDAVFDL